MRCAMVHQGSLTLMDFSPSRLAMLRAQESPQNSGQKIVSTPTEIKAGRCFLRNFTSKLPYCECKKDEIKNRVLMDDEWILEIEVRFRLCTRFYHGSRAPFRRRRVCLAGKAISTITAYYRRRALVKDKNQMFSMTCTCTVVCDNDTSLRRTSSRSNNSSHICFSLTRL